MHLIKLMEVDVEGLTDQLECSNVQLRIRSPTPFVFFRIIHSTVGSALVL